MATFVLSINKQKQLWQQLLILETACASIWMDNYFIVEFLHVKPGKGAAFVRTKLKNVTTGGY